MIHSDKATRVDQEVPALDIAGRVSARTAASPRPHTPLGGQIGGSADPEPAAEGATCAPTRQPGLKSWPLLVLAAPAAVAVWSGWVGIGQMTGFGEIRPLPGIWNSLHIDGARVRGDTRSLRRTPSASVPVRMTYLSATPSTGRAYGTPDHAQPSAAALPGGARSWFR
jgi:hypothetical protein